MKFYRRNVTSQVATSSDLYKERDVSFNKYRLSRLLLHHTCTLCVDACGFSLRVEILREVCVFEGFIRRKGNVQILN